MTTHPRHAFDVAPGEPQLSPLALIFRRAIAAVRRKPAVPEVQTTASGAGAGGSDWDDVMPARFPCCEHCTLEDGSRCAPPDSHLAACGDGCNTAEPVLGDAMLSTVREQWNAFHDDAEPAAPAPWRPSSAMSTGEFRALDVQVDYWRAQPRRPVNGQARPDQPRRAVPFGELNRKFSDGRPTPELLRQVLAGLKKLGTEREATYRGGWQ